MQQLTEEGLKKGVLWHFRQNKTPFKNETIKNLKSIEEETKDSKQEKIVQGNFEDKEERLHTPTLEKQINWNNRFETPPQRIFPELDGIAKYQGKDKTVFTSQSTKKQEDSASEEVRVSEEQVVEEVNKLRKGIAKAEKTIPEGPGDKKKDNVPTQEVVDIINQQREEERLKTPYANLSLPSDYMTYEEMLKQCVSPKMKELEKIFEEQGERMEWERIVNETSKSIAKDKPVESMCSPAVGNFTDLLRCAVQRNIVEKLETHDVIKKYNDLNKNFEVRVKEENREVDEKNVNDKRAQKSPKQIDYQKKRGVESKESRS